jgi:hypothetical protein
VPGEEDKLEKEGGLRGFPKTSDGEPEKDSGQQKGENTPFYGCS